MTAIKSVTEGDVNHIVSFIEDTVKKSGSDGVILGLSGGLDSAVVAKLSVRALGTEKVIAVSMPSSITNDSEIARSFAESLGIEFHSVPIGEVVEIISKMTPDEDTPIDKGNISTRCRMSILYNMARKRNALVIGTSNKSELMTGYFTKYGDGACDLMPLSGVYKTQVREIASMISIPEELISKPPSAGFWEGQTDEEEMGLTYDALDPILDLIEKGTPSERISSVTGQSPMVVARIIETVRASEHKRHPPARP